MNLVLLLVFGTVVIKVTLCEELGKCCASEEILTKEDNLYKCTKDITQRHQIFVENNDFLKTNTNGSCVDVFKNDFVKYDVSARSLQANNGSVFPKCCPLNRIYNSEIHSCVEKQDVTLDFIKETYIKVGLVECKIIADFEVEETDDKFNLLHIRKRLNSVDEYNSFCLDKNEKNSLILRECQGSFDHCKNSKCIKKCCPDGQSFVNGSNCVDTYEHGLNLSVLSSSVEKHQEKYSIIHNRTCKQIYKMSAFSNVTVHKNGSFTEWSSINAPRTVDVTDMNSYCIEHSTRINMNGYFFFHCFVGEKPSHSKYEFRVWPFALSCIFLLLTAAVYVIIKEYKKTFGKILVSYCLTSFILFSILLWNRMNRPINRLCHIQSFLLEFFALAQFTWANVMSFEIWCTFGTTKMYLGTKYNEMELKKFLLYNLYAWGVPLLVTLTVYLFTQWKILPDAIQPYLGHTRCFFDRKEGNYATFLFYNIPILVIQIINTAFFVKTVMYCMKVKNEINKINAENQIQSVRRYQHDKERLFLIIKLSVVMGISFIWEVVSGFFKMSEYGEGPKYLEIVLDIYNALQGVFIFIIFICKKKVLTACLEKLNIISPRSRNSASSHTQSSLTLNGVVLNNFGSKDSVNNNRL